MGKKNYFPVERNADFAAGDQASGIKAECQAGWGRYRRGDFD